MKSLRLYSSLSSPSQTLISIVANGVGGLDTMESDLNNLKIPITPSLLAAVITSRHVSDPRRLLRFLSWSPLPLSSSLLDLSVLKLSDLNDPTALSLSLRNYHFALDPNSFSSAVHSFTRSGRPDLAIGLFRNIAEKKSIKLRNDDTFSPVTALVHALCEHGHARKAKGVLYHHKDDAERNVRAHRNLLVHGWSVFGNVKEARNVVEEIKKSGDVPSLASYHDLLRCLCERNVRFNPSGLVPEAMNLVTEMRSVGVLPCSATYNIVLSCLGRIRRVKEACNIMLAMTREESIFPDTVSYFLVVRVLYLTKRFGRGNRIVEQMIGEEEKGRLVPKANAKIYHDLISVLIGVENVDCALKLFERMKQRCVCENEKFGQTYDLLIEKLCRNGKYDVGKNLWDEAAERGISLKCSSDLLDPLKAPQPFHPTKKPLPIKIVPHKPHKSIAVPKWKKGTNIVSRRNNQSIRKKVRWRFIGG